MDNNDGGPFHSRPSDFDADQTAERILQGLELSPTNGFWLAPPPTHLQTDILRTIDLPDHWPKENWLPCAICSDGKPKFRHGYLIWSSDGWLRVIGNCCGAGHFGAEAYGRLVSQRKRRIEIQNAQDALLSNLHKVNALKERVAQLKCDARELIKKRKQIEKHFPRMWRSMKMMSLSNGAFIVERRTSSGLGLRSSSGHQSDAVVDVLSPLLGGQIFAVSLRAVAQLERDLNTLPLVKSEDEALQWVCDHEEEPNAILSAAQSLDSCEVRYRNINKKVSDAKLFFSAENFRNLANWCNHPNSGLDISAEASGSRLLLRSHEGTECLLAFSWGCASNRPGASR